MIAAAAIIAFCWTSRTAPGLSLDHPWTFSTNWKFAMFPCSTYFSAKITFITLILILFSLHAEKVSAGWHRITFSLHDRIQLWILSPIQTLPIKPSFFLVRLLNFFLVIWSTSSCEGLPTRIYSAWLCPFGAGPLDATHAWARPPRTRR